MVHERFAYVWPLREKDVKSISIVIPARNEETTIGKVLDDLNGTIANCPQYSFEVIVVIDSVDDPTGTLARNKGAQVVCNQYGKGKGAALASGFKSAKGDAIIMFDSDGSHNPKDIGTFLDALEKGAGLVIGSRVVGGSDDHNVTRLFGNAVFTFIFSLLFGVNIMDVLNGYKAFRREIIADCRQRAKGFDVEIEITAQAVRKGYKIVEVSTHENRRSGGLMKSHALRDGFQILIAILRNGFSYRLGRLLHPVLRIQKSASSL